MSKIHFHSGAEPIDVVQQWSSLSPTEQLKLRTEYADEIDRQPLTCAMDEKIRRFSTWLAGRGVQFDNDDVA